MHLRNIFKVGQVPSLFTEYHVYGGPCDLRYAACMVPPF